MPDCEHPKTARLREHGVRRVSLVVDSESPTGATRLHERAGMHAERSYAVYRKGAAPGCRETRIGAPGPPSLRRRTPQEGHARTRLRML